MARCIHAIGTPKASLCAHHVCSMANPGVPMPAIGAGVTRYFDDEGCVNWPVRTRNACPVAWIVAAVPQDEYSRRRDYISGLAAPDAQHP